jgi:hypothetical protein
MSAERSKAGSTQIVETSSARISLCENGMSFISLIDETDVDAPVLRAVLTHLKDARAALERAKGAIP